MLYLLTVNYYSAELIAKLRRSLTSVAFEKLVIVNNSPEDKALKDLQSDPHIKIIETNTNLGFGSACNLGLAWIFQQNPQAIAWLINPDAYLEPDSGDALTWFAKHPEIQILGTLIKTATGAIWSAGGDFNSSNGGIAARKSLPEESLSLCDWISGCSLLLNLTHFTEPPSFDPTFFLYYEDFDFCQRYQEEGYPIYFTTDLVVIHQPSSISDRALSFKYRTSTFSYLLVLMRYTSLTVFSWRFIRLLLHGVILLPLRPQIGWGKLAGIQDFWQSDV